MGNSLQKLSESREKEAGKASFTCEICTETMSVKHQFSHSVCTHSLCQDCIAHYIEEEIQEHNVAKLECLRCRQLLDPVACRSIIPRRVFVKWCDLLCESYLIGFDRSYCPNKNCLALVVNECGKVDKAECPNCKEWFCFQCKSALHEGYRCEEIEKCRDSKDIAFEKLEEKMEWVRCPGCGHCVERESPDCRVLICRCQTGFCYDCGGNKIPCPCDLKTQRGFILFLLIILLVPFGISYLMEA